MKDLTNRNLTHNPNSAQHLAIAAVSAPEVSPSQAHAFPITKLSPFALF